MEKAELNTYQKENEQVANMFFESYWINNLKHKNNFNAQEKTLELIISPKCNLACKYCYINRYHDKIFNDDLYDEKDILKNLQYILNWLKKENLNPCIDIFSGELLAQNIGWKVLDLIYTHESMLPDTLRSKQIRIPTNFTFLCDDDLTKRMEQLIDSFKMIGISLMLSASFDGKFLEQNRPFKTQLDIPINVIRDDNYYNKVFTFIEKYGCGIHPMVYSKDISKWIDNFEWFQAKMEEYDIPWYEIYLLQVRNLEWTDDEITDLQKFIKHIYYFAWEKCQQNKEKFSQFIFKEHGFNLLGEMIGIVNRGLGCAIQTTLHVRVSDLAIVPCHRLGYDDFLFGHLSFDENNNIFFNCKHLELMLAIEGFHHQNGPGCEFCNIRSLCLGPCLGAQQEANNNMFVNIPSVCKMEHAVFLAICQCIKETGCGQVFYNLLQTDSQREEFNNLMGKV